MRQEEKVITFNCDMCGAENIKPQKLRHTEVFGYTPTEPKGVRVILEAFGNSGYCEHICEACADKAMAAAFAAEFERKKQYKFGNVTCSQCGGEFGPGDTGFSHCENHKHLPRLG